MKQAITLCELSDEDWKTQLAHKYSNIPEGVIVDIIDEDIQNYYGTWQLVRWNGNTYYVSKRNLNYNIEDIQNLKTKELSNAKK